jgi:hypothetical protein
MLVPPVPSVRLVTAGIWQGAYRRQHLIHHNRSHPVRVITVAMSS